MKRAWLTVFGSGLLLVVFGLTALLGGSLWADPLRALQLLLFISGAVAFLAAGRNRTVAGLSFFEERIPPFTALTRRLASRSHTRTLAFWGRE